MKDGFDHLVDHVIITDAHANILYANDAAEKTTGFSKEEMLGKNPADLWGGNMPDEFYRKMWRIIKEEKQPFVGEVKNKRKDGKEYWQELHISPILDQDGEVKFFIGMEPEITDRKTAEKFREEFLSIASHQLRNPLTAISWLLDFLFKRGSVTDEQRKILGDIYIHNNNLINLVDDLLVLARVEKGSSAIKLIDLYSEVKEIVDLAQKSYRNVFLEFSANGESFKVSTIEMFARQIFSNIITNAVEYSGKGSGKRVVIALSKTGREYVFSCKDNGVGIPEKDKERIFERFFRASNSKDAKESGTGLGLFIVKMLADYLGWSVSFESEIGEGTTFFVKIPRN